MPRRDLGNPCPACGGPMARHAQRCMACSVQHRHRHPTQPTSPDAVHTVGRRESIITYEGPAGQVLTAHCVAVGRPAQIAAGRRQLHIDDTWEVLCVSNPASILRDLQKERQR